MFRTLAVAVPVLLGGYYLFGSAGSYSRLVDRPPAEVAAALDDLDIGEQPGSPGSDPSRSGGVKAIVSHARTADGVTWTVMSGDKVAITMTATLTPVDGGKRTRVTARVARGNAPDDFVPPAFRSTGIAKGLFGMALEAELDELTAPPAGDPRVCEALFERFQAANLASPDLQQRDGLKDAIGDTAAIGVRLAAFQAEARRLGCDRKPAGEGFAPVTSAMGPAPAEGEAVSYKPGAPMVRATPR
ncbi:MAG: hypothetical protein V4574_12345 [Pseudomonadota bacterium]